MSATFLLAFFLAAPPAGAGDPLADILKSLEKEKDAGARRLLASKLSLSNEPRAAERLARLIREDPDPAVRIAAAAGLSLMSFEGVEEGLMTVLSQGGIHGVREALAKGIGNRQDGLPLIDRAIRSQRTEPGVRGLLVRSLGWMTGKATLDHLLSLTEDDDPFLRSEALRGLADRRDLPGEKWVPLLENVLRKRRDIETLMAALDTMETLRDPALLPVVERLETFLDPAIKEAVSHVMAVLRLEQWKRLAEKAARDGYDPPPAPREGEPRPRARLDFVFVLDATGSVSGHMEKIRDLIRDRHRFLVQEGFDVRIGLVSYRDHQRAAVPMVQVLPLTYDFAAMEAFLDAVKPSGADAQGASIHRGLEESLDRMSWRWTGARSVYLVADSKCGDVERTRNVVAVHRVGDGTRTHVIYLLRTRGKVPEDIRELAASAGGTVEILE